ncbi:hypothetical protein HY624_01465 [Candidatus Uhrbacteria bacterium]|nr:hypothetical protein [Candidatus Uhrbacteria bacterium]
MNLQELTSAIKKEDWEYLVDRRETVLHRSFTAACYDYFFEETGIKISRATVVRPGGDVWYPQSVLEKVRETFRRGGVARCLDFQKRLIRTVRALDRLATRYERRKSFAHFSDVQLRRMLSEFVTFTIRANAFLLPFPVADGVIVDLIRAELPQASRDQQTEWICTLTFPVKENAHARELRSLLMLAQRSNEQRIVKHRQRFSWIGARGLWWQDAWTPAMIRARIHASHAAGKNPVEVIAEQRAVRRAIMYDARRLTQTLAIKHGSRLAKLIAIARDYAYLRTWRTDVVYGSSYRARGLFQELARRSHVDYFHLPYLTFQEFQELVLTFRFPITQQELRRRIAAGKDYLVTIRCGREYFVYTGKRWVAYFQKLVRGNTQQSRVTAVRGSIAYPGVVRGRARIVLSTDDLSKVRRGDILVAVMTFPNFIPAMEKAAAFVTDEGGILCHASIVSREMGKPCVIGTKSATTVFRDGDRIEVDATHCIVRKL